MNQSLMLPIGSNLSTEGGLATYIRTVNSLPVLNAEQERELAIRFHQAGDLDAARQLVLANLRYVVRVAKGYSGYGLAQADLIQEGNIGLMKAVKSFDPAHGVRLLSFAVHWIRAEMYEFILRNWRIVKVATTKAQRKLFFNLRKSRSHLGPMNLTEIDNLASDLDVPVETVKEMESRLTNLDVPFDGYADNDDDDFHAAPAAYLKDMRYNPESLYTQTRTESARDEQLNAVLQKLDDRSRDIIRRRWLDDDKPTLHDLAREYGISAERVRQIEKKAMVEIKKTLASANK